MSPSRRGSKRGKGGGQGGGPGGQGGGQAGHGGQGGQHQGGGNSRGQGGNAGRGNAKGNAKNRGKKPGGHPAGDRNRPFWETNAADAKVQALIGEVRPAQDPTALVRSLGEPPLGRFADTAPHYYAAVYERAQRFAVAMATANGVQILGPDDDPGSTGSDG